MSQRFKSTSPSLRARKSGFLRFIDRKNPQFEQALRLNLTRKKQARCKPAERGQRQAKNPPSYCATARDSDSPWAVISRLFSKE
ncbi:MAG: hypothetical protein LBD18_00795 [Treponema sp.]|nr:hypothetical protein [Treponema sp.]